jgi:hypothetical protein
VKHHPITTIMGRLAHEQGIDVDKINASTQQRAAITLIVELLDMATAPIMTHPDVVPAAALALRGYAELLETATETINADPNLSGLRDFAAATEHARVLRNRGSR